MYSGVKADLPKLWQDLRKKEPQTELEKLQAERPMPEGRECVAKKVKTLVKEQETRARFNGQKPSTN